MLIFFWESLSREKTLLPFCLIDVKRSHRDYSHRTKPLANEEPPRACPRRPRCRAAATRHCRRTRSPPPHNHPCSAPPRRPPALAAATVAVGTTMEELGATSAAVGTTMVELEATSLPLVAAPTASALILLQAADTLGRLDAAPTSRAPPGPSPSLVVDAPASTVNCKRYLV